MGSSSCLAYCPFASRSLPPNSPSETFFARAPQMPRPATPPQSSSFPALPVQATFICSLRSKPSPFSSRKPSSGFLTSLQDLFYMA